MRRNLGNAMLSAIAATAVACGAASAAHAAPNSENPIALERASLPHCEPRDERVGAGDATRLSLGCRGINNARAEIVKGPRHGKVGRVSQERDEVRYRPDDGYTGPDHLVVERERGAHVFRASVRIAVGGDGDAATCKDGHAIARSESAVEIRIRCRGEGLEKLKLRVASLDGAVEKVRQERDEGDDVRTATARFEPAQDFSGQEALVVDAGSGLGAIDISVLPWRMRTIGDSVTAGFGFYGDGSAMQESDLISCEPPDGSPNNRCSSNSDERGNYSGTAEWSSDFGLMNNTSWAAQFANSITPNGMKVTAPEMFQNLAVTGSAPSDWLPNGSLNSELNGVIAENPELIAMTMGANPLLSDILESREYEFNCAPKTTVQELQDCIRPAFDQAQLTQRLQQLYTAILNGAPDSTVVVFHYHLADPSLTLFSNWQIEAMIDFLAAHISNAVENTEKALPGEAARLILIPAQIEPGNPQPNQVPRFNIGMPPVSQQLWTATYDCGKSEMVDGPSHQSTSTQDELTRDSSSFCPGDPWIISSDTGIHPNADGYTQFANALANVAAANNLVPPAG